MEQGFASDSNRCKSLVSSCLGALGPCFEDFIEDHSEIALYPADTKMKLLAIAKRRGQLSDSVLLALVDCSWELLDISGSDVTDTGLQSVAEICPKLKAVDISWCNQLTSESICALLQKCHSLETLRCGGTPLSDANARRCLDFMKPKLNEVEVDSWEELDSKDIITGARALRWLIWPSIDEDSKKLFQPSFDEDSKKLVKEYPRITVNPSAPRYNGLSVPRDALPGIDLDAEIVKDIDPNAWTINQAPNILRFCMELCLYGVLLLREARDVREKTLAPKRAKNIRQHQRRAKRIHKI